MLSLCYFLKRPRNKRAAIIVSSLCGAGLQSKPQNTYKTNHRTRRLDGRLSWRRTREGKSMFVLIMGERKVHLWQSKKHINGSRYVTYQFYKCTHPNDSEWWITLTQHHKSIFSLPYKKKFMQFLNPSLQPESKTVDVRTQGTGILTILSYKTMTKSDNDSKKIKKYASQFPQKY